MTKCDIYNQVVITVFDFKYEVMIMGQLVPEEVNTLYMREELTLAIYIIKKCISDKRYVLIRVKCSFQKRINVMILCY